MKIAGLDIGSTASKLCVYEESGELVRTYEREYPQRHGSTQIDVRALWNAVEECLCAAAGLSDLKAIGITSFGETCILLDEKDEPLMEALLYTDSRGEEEAVEIASHFGKRLPEITGLSPSGMYSLPKLIWIKRHMPGIFQKARYIPEVEDYIVYRLTGRKQVDYSLASRTMAFNVQKRTWSRELLDYAGIDPNLLSTPVPIGTSAGPMLPHMARRFGLGPDVQVVSVSHDQVAVVTGAGGISPGQAVDGGGTVQCVTPVYEGYPDMDLIAKGKFAVVPFLTPNQFASYAFTFTGGALLKWYRDMILKQSEMGGSFYEQLNAAMPEGPTELLVLPHFCGAGTPYMDASSTGAILGLKTHITQAHLYKALMEGVAFEMRTNIRFLKAAGIAVHSLRATGGAARSAEWMQIKADVLGCPITVLQNEQCGAVGSVMLAGRAIGAYADLREASGIFVREGSTYIPDASRHAQYTMLYKKYSRVYKAMKGVWQN